MSTFICFGCNVNEVSDPNERCGVCKAEGAPSTTGAVGGGGGGGVWPIPSDAVVAEIRRDYRDDDDCGRDTEI
jgi:hypothetical protein